MQLDSLKNEMNEMNKCTTANIKYRNKNTYLFQFVYYCSFLHRLETVKMYITVLNKNT